MSIPGACFVGTTLSRRPGQRWVVVAWSEDGERCVLAALPAEPNAALSSARGADARIVKASALRRAIDGGVLVVAGGLGVPALTLVARALQEDVATPGRVRELLGRRR